MKISKKSIENILDLQKNKNPRIHCMIDATSSNDLRQAILCYNGEATISKNRMEVYEMTAKGNGLLISLEEVEDEEIIAIEKALRATRSKNIPVILDISGIDISAYRRSIVLSLLNRHSIELIVGNKSEFEILIEAQNRDYNNSKLDYRNFSKKNRVISVIKGEGYFITDGYSEIIIKNGVESFNKIASVQCILNGMMSIGVSSGNTREERIEAALIAILIFSISQEIVYKKSDYEIDYALMKNYLYNEISKITAEDINRYAEINYNFKR